MNPTLTCSTLTEQTAIYNQVCPARFPWSHVIKRGQIFRIVDIEGCQAVDTLFYNAHDYQERYSAPDTIRTQNNIFLSTGTTLVSSRSRAMLTIIADTCGRHDTSGGACSAESNSVRFGLETRHMHACRDNFVLELAKYGMTKKDLVSNINFFMNVPVQADGQLAIVDGISSPGSYVEMVAEMDVLCVISNCPQMNNPCNAYNPTPIRMLIWDSPA
ncbi:MAG: urea carboxylase-associated family protein [Phycisphaerales bacterium]|nr:urea carboxylase-associated family protein [Phycisphaerales bacterium]